MVKRAPLKVDRVGKCTRWHVVVYNRNTRQYKWHTVRGTKREAKALERRLYDAQEYDEISGVTEGKTFEEVASLFIIDRQASNRGAATLNEYRTELKLRLLPRAAMNLPLLGSRDIRKIERADMQAHFNALREKGYTVSQVNKTIKAAKTILTFAFDFEYVESNVLDHYPYLQREGWEPGADRGVSSELNRAGTTGEP